MGPLGSGPRCGTDGLGQHKTPDMLGFFFMASGGQEEPFSRLALAV